MDERFLLSVSLDPNAADDPDEHPFSVPSIQQLGKLEFHPRVTFFVGENGAGKSTLLEAIAEKCGFSVDGGTRNTNINQQAPLSPLARALNLWKTRNKPMDGFFLRAENFCNFATIIEEIGAWGYGGKSLHAQSHGESFLATMNHRMGGNGVYLFDEPEAALSPQNQLAMLVRMHDLVADCSQFVIATHSPILMAYPDAWIYQFSEDGIERVELKDTSHYQITNSFMRDPAGMIQRLLHG